MGWARIPAERHTEVIKTLMVNDGGVERRQTPAEEGQAGDVRRIALLALQGPSASAGAGGGKGQQHTSQSAGIQGSAGQAATGAMGSGAVEGGSPGTADCSGSGQGGLGELTGTSGGPETGGDNAGAGRPALGASKIKISMVMDQADDTEIQPLHPGVLRSMIEHWKTNSNDGEDPTEGEEATGDQLSALAFRIRSGRTPFVDFGVWRPHGTDMGKALKFSAFFTCPVSGEYVKKEISGPETIGDWNKAWRVFSFAMEVLGAATRTRLKRYSDRVQQMAEDYHDLWWIIACAEHKMRKLHLERIRRRLASEHSELQRVGLPSSFQPDAPWDLAFREAARDEHFWTTEVDKKVLQYCTAQRTRNQLIDPGFGAIRYANQGGKRSRDDGSSDGPPAKRTRRKSKKERDQEARKAKGGERRKNSGGGGGGKGKGKGDAVSSAGKYYRDENRVQLCWAWNKSRDGCAEPCPHNRSHLCEWCREPHRTIHCTKPGRD